MTKGRIVQLLGSLALLLLLTSTASAATFRLSGTRAPANMSAPTVSGTAKIGNLLSTTAGYWSGSKPTLCRLTRSLWRFESSLLRPKRSFDESCCRWVANRTIAPGERDHGSRLTSVGEKHDEYA